MPNILKHCWKYYQPWEHLPSILITAASRYPAMELIPDNLSEACSEQMLNMFHSPVGLSPFNPIAKEVWLSRAQRTLIRSQPK